jgi:hypothetical protein
MNYRINPQSKVSYLAKYHILLTNNPFPGKLNHMWSFIFIYIFFYRNGKEDAVKFNLVV